MYKNYFCLIILTLGYSRYFFIFLFAYTQTKMVWFMWNKIIFFTLRSLYTNWLWNYGDGSISILFKNTWALSKSIEFIVSIHRDWAKFITNLSKMLFKFEPVQVFSMIQMPSNCSHWWISKSIRRNSFRKLPFMVMRIILYEQLNQPKSTHLFFRRV